MMLEFSVVAALLVLVAVATILFPLLRNNDTDGAIDRGDANLQVLRDQLAELDVDLGSGVLSADQYESARAELERRVLDESPHTQSTVSDPPRANRWRTPVMIGVLLPVFAVLLYLFVGSVDGLDVEAFIQRQAAAIAPERVESMTRQLAQRLEDEPDDVEGWAMLGRSYMVLQQYTESARAWERAATLEPDDASILTNYAEVQGLASQGNLDGEPTQLLARALAADPDETIIIEVTYLRDVALPGFVLAMLMDMDAPFSRDATWRKTP